MRHLSHSSIYPSKLLSIGSYRSKALLVLAMMLTMASAAFATPQPTTTKLAISATSVPYKTPITLTATVSRAAPRSRRDLFSFAKRQQPFAKTIPLWVSLNSPFPARPRQ